jgi:hypothetical protein
MKRALIIGFGIVAAGAVASAAVSFDSTTGSGFVGKGDVQLALGLNNKQVQLTPVTFTYSETEVADVTCEWDTETGGKVSKTIHHAVTNEKTAGIDSSVVYDARVRNQITGYNLVGFGSITATGTIPSVGDACPNSNDGVVTEVLVTNSIPGALSVNGVLLQ